MKRTFQAVLLAVSTLFPAGQLNAEAVVAARAIPGKSIVAAADFALVETDIPGAYSRIEDLIGLETRVTLYPGRPVLRADLGPPAVVERNDVVQLRFRSAGLMIVTDGRALERAGVGDRIRVMNLSSRQTVTGQVSATGFIEVGQ